MMLFHGNYRPSGEVQKANRTRQITDMKTRFVAGMAASIVLVIFSLFSVENSMADQGHHGSRGHVYSSPGRAAYAYRYPRYIKAQPKPNYGIYPRHPQHYSTYPYYRGYNPYYRNYYYRNHIGSIGRPYIHVRYDYHRNSGHPYYHHYHHDERRR